MKEYALQDLSIPENTQRKATKENYEGWVGKEKIKLFESAYLLAGLMPAENSNDLLQQCSRSTLQESSLEVQAIRSLYGQVGRGSWAQQIGHVYATLEERHFEKTQAFCQAIVDLIAEENEALKNQCPVEIFAKIGSPNTPQQFIESINETIVSWAKKNSLGNDAIEILIQKASDTIGDLTPLSISRLKFYVTPINKPFFFPSENPELLAAYQAREQKNAEEGFNFIITLQEFLEFCKSIYHTKYRSIPYLLQDALCAKFGKEHRRRMNEWKKRKCTEGDELINHREMEKILKQKFGISSSEVRSFWVGYYEAFSRTDCNISDVNNEYTVCSVPKDNAEYRASYFFKNEIEQFEPPFRLLPTSETLKRIENHDIGEECPKKFLYDFAKRGFFVFYLKDGTEVEEIAFEDALIKQRIEDGTALFKSDDVEGMLSDYPSKIVAPQSPNTADERWIKVSELLPKERNDETEQSLLEKIYDDNSHLHKKYGNSANKGTLTKHGFVNGYKKWKKRSASN